MRKVLIVICLFAPLLAVGAPAADAIVGVWLTTNNGGFIQIYRNGKHYNGRVVGAPPDSPSKNPKLLGTQVLKDFVYNGKGTWENGTAYDPEKDKTYSAEMWLADHDTLKMRGYIGISLFGRTETWTRSSADAKGVVAKTLK